MQLSESISRISVSPTAAVVMKADKLKSSGINLVDFGAGEPDFPTPENIKRAAIEALEKNFTKYTATGGIRELKAAIVERHARDFGSHYAPEECLVTVGGKQAIFEAVAATVNPGDEVLLPVPYWVSFLDIIRYAGGNAVLVATDQEKNFALTAAEAAKRITPKTRMMIVNSPNNPTGAVVPPEEMQKVVALAIERDLLLLSDECYCHFLYDGRKPYSLGSTRERDHLVITGSFSKTYSMTGWRVGYALGTEKLLSSMLKLQSHSTSNPTSFAQRGALEALRGPQDSIARMLAEYTRRRDSIVEGLRAIPGVRLMKPQGAFYVYPDISAYLKKDGVADATKLAEKLLDEAHVAVVPGPAFGTEDHVRISYATSLDQINEGLGRMKDFFAKL
ncbi:MAG: pyridoxal phosphate-dependent aminotransferase [Acidobacteria bacterium]|nr:MAG: pyridoxal phosphate-dependent aminotransferase [Acidobacteriota bacterium]